MANILQGITQKFSSLFSGGPKGSVIGVDVGSSSIKIVQIKNDQGVAMLETYGAVSFGSYVENSYPGQALNPTHEQTIKAVQDLIQEASITSLRGAVAIPSAASLVFMLELPATINQKDLASIVPLESRKYIPVPMSEVSLDWWVVPQDEISEGTDDAPSASSPSKQPVRVLVAAIHNDALTRFRAVVQDAKFRTDFFEIEMFSNVRSCVGQDLSTIALIDFGASKTKVSLVRRGVVQDFHSINRGSETITRAIATALSVPLNKAETIKRAVGLTQSSEYPNLQSVVQGSFEYTLSELNAIILSYEKKYNTSIDSIIITGGGSALPGLIEYLNTRLPVSVVKSNPFSRVKTPAFLSDVLSEVGPEFGVALGLALRALKQE